MLDFAGRVAIVTGAGRGLGKAHALMLASRGARLVVNDLAPSGTDTGPADDAVREIAHAGGIAVADGNNVVGGAEALVRTAIEAFGRLDIVVNNAGVIHRTPFAQTPAAQWQADFDVHLRGTVEVCRAAWPHLVASGSGRIVNTASSGMLGKAGLTSYGAAKAAVFGFTRSLAVEGEPHGVTANCILPIAWTPMAETVRDSAHNAFVRRHFQPEHVAAFVAWLAHQDTRVSKALFHVGGGRARSVVMAMRQTVAASASSPEGWAESRDGLLADGELSLFDVVHELLGIDSPRAPGEQADDCP